MLVNLALCKNMVLYCHVCIAFLPNPPIAILELFMSQMSQLFMSQMANFPKTLLLVSLVKIQYARDNEGPYFCINQNKNIDDPYCNSNHLFKRININLK